MKTPKFWNNKNSIVSVLLIPLSFLWQLSSLIHKKRPHKLDIPIIKIGNVVAGGAGKTPTVISLTKKLKNSGVNVHIISKGYKSSVKESIQVNTKLHTFKEVGDEALLCAKIATTWVGRSRLQSIKCAIKEGARLVILDDGIQDDSIKSNLNILIFNGSQGIGNGRIIPAGPMRETLQDAIKKSQLAIIIEEDKSNINKFISDFSIESLYKIDRSIENRTNFEYAIPKYGENNGTNSFPHPYQLRLKDQVLHYFLNNQHQKTLVTMPTGAGKTVLAMEVVIDLFRSYRVDSKDSCIPSPIFLFDGTFWADLFM